jgi:acetolactate decarboxylase
VKRHGDFGIATFDGLDGEMVAVEPEFFQVTADGRVHPVSEV